MSSIRLHREHGLNPTVLGCYWCGEDKNEIALLGAAYKGEAPMRMILDYVPCDKCKAQMALGITVYAVTTMPKQANQMPLYPGAKFYPTGQWAVVKEDADLWPESMKAEILKSRKCLMTETEYNLIFAPEPDRE